MTTPIYREGYCTPEDIRLDDPPEGVVIERLIAAGAEYMDGYLGQVYQLPIVLDPQLSSHKGDHALLSRLNQYLAAAFYYRERTADKKSDEDHKYGRALYDEARQELSRISAGRTVIESAEPLHPEDGQPNGPLVANRDAGSFVDAFYHSKGSAHGSWEGWGIGISG